MASLKAMEQNVLASCMEQAQVALASLIVMSQMALASLMDSDVSDSFGKEPYSAPRPIYAGKPKWMTW